MSRRGMAVNPSQQLPPFAPGDPRTNEPRAGAARRFLTITELAEQTGISVSTLQRLRRKGAIPCFQPGGPRTRVVFPPDAIEQADQLRQNTSNLSTDARED